MGELEAFDGCCNIGYTALYAIYWRIDYGLHISISMWVKRQA